MQISLDHRGKFVCDKKTTAKINRMCKMHCKVRGYSGIRCTSNPKKQCICNPAKRPSL